jgi:hypothetical protein
MKATAILVKGLCIVVTEIIERLTSRKLLSREVIGIEFLSVGVPSSLTPSFVSKTSRAF